MARILVVDDEPDVLLLTRVVLEGAGHETVLAADGERALERLEAGDVDLVVLDVCMPVRDGWSVLRSIQAGAHPVPVIIVSGRAKPGDVDHARSLGAVDYVAKPYSPEGLNAAVDRAFARDIGGWPLPSVPPGIPPLGCGDPNPNP